jgi:hypothetical protein
MLRLSESRRICCDFNKLPRRVKKLGAFPAHNRGRTLRSAACFGYRPSDRNPNEIGVACR